MKRFNIYTLAVLTALSLACGGGTDESGSPTAPSQGQTPTTSSGGGSCSIPGAPGNLAVSAVGTRVTFNWAPVNGVIEYIVLVGTSPSSSNTISTNTTNPEFFWNGAANGSYYARIQSRNACGTSGSSNEVAFTVSGQ